MPLAEIALVMAVFFTFSVMKPAVAFLVPPTIKHPARTIINFGWTLKKFFNQPNQ